MDDDRSLSFPSSLHSRASLTFTTLTLEHTHNNKRQTAAYREEEEEEKERKGKRRKKKGRAELKERKTGGGRVIPEKSTPKKKEKAQGEEGRWGARESFAWVMVIKSWPGSSCMTTSPCVTLSGSTGVPQQRDNGEGTKADNCIECEAPEPERQVSATRTSATEFACIQRSRG